MNEDISKLLAQAGQKTNTSQQEISEMVKKGNAADIMKKLSPEDLKKLNNILNDKEATEKILNSPQAKQIMKMLKHEK